MSTGFEKYSNYSESSSFSSVVFGAEKPLLEVELNELQQIINTKLSRIMKVLGTCVIPLSNDSITFDSSSKMVFISDCLILEKSGLTAYVGSATVSVERNSCVYFKIWEKDVSYTDDLKSNGYLYNSMSAPNTIKDSRVPIETTRRKAVVYTLHCGYSLPSDTDKEKYVEVGNYDSTDDKFIPTIQGILDRVNKMEVQLGGLYFFIDDENILCVRTEDEVDSTKTVVTEDSTYGVASKELSGSTDEEAVYGTFEKLEDEEI